jgi:hypothetical protein
VVLAACRTEAPSTVEAGFDAGLLAFTFAEGGPSTAPSVASSPAPNRLALYSAAVPRTSKSIGHTSVVFRIDFDSDAGALRAAYKPESKRGHKRYRGEVAAYRLAVALGIPNVPPAAIRTFQRDALRASTQGDAHALALFDDEVIDRESRSEAERFEAKPLGGLGGAAPHLGGSGRVYGALMPWIDKLEFIPLESPTEKARWKKELTSGAELPEDRRALVAQISTLVVFDALTGNWDRWSGANVGIDKATGSLLFVDNDAAFFDPVPPLFAAQLAILRGVDRFSRSLVRRLRTLDAVSMADAFGEEEPGSPLLSAHAVAAADQRRKDVLAIIDEKIAALSDAAVLFFP